MSPAKRAPAPEPQAVITVGAVRDRTCTSKLIGYFGGGAYSHWVSLVLPGGREVIDSRYDKVGGAPPGVQVRDIAYLRDYECLWLDVPVTQAQAAAYEAALRSVLARPYDSVGIVDFALGRTSDHSWRDASAFFCSDLGAWGFNQSGVCGPYFEEPTRSTPGDMVYVCWGKGARPAQTPAGLLAA